MKPYSGGTTVAQSKGATHHSTQLGVVGGLHKHQVLGHAVEIALEVVVGQGQLAHGVGFPASVAFSVWVLLAYGVGLPANVGEGEGGGARKVLPEHCHLRPIDNPSHAPARRLEGEGEGEEPCETWQRPHPSSFSARKLVM